MEEMLEVMKTVENAEAYQRAAGGNAGNSAYCGWIFVNRMSQMTAAMSEAADKLQQVDVDGINDAIGTTQEMLECRRAFRCGRFRDIKSKRVQ